jgi:hypothetical protein
MLSIVRNVLIAVISVFMMFLIIGVDVVKQTLKVYKENECAFTDIVSAHIVHTGPVLRCYKYVVDNANTMQVYVHAPQITDYTSRYIVIKGQTYEIQNIYIDKNMLQDITANYVRGKQLNALQSKLYLLNSDVPCNISLQNNKGIVEGLGLLSIKSDTKYIVYVSENTNTQLLDVYISTKKEIGLVKILQLNTGLKTKLLNLLQVIIVLSNLFVYIQSISSTKEYLYIVYVLLEIIGVLIYQRRKNIKWFITYLHYMLFCDC